MKVSSGPSIGTISRFLRRHEIGACAVAVFLVGIFVRLLLLSQVTLNEKPEPVQIALSLIEKGTYADAFGRNVGPTAHCLPLHPFILAGLFRIFGSGTNGSIAISIFSSISAALAYALLPALGRTCGLGVGPGFLAGIIGALIPVNFWAQTNGTFEASYTAFGLAGLCCLVNRCWSRGLFDVRNGIRIGILGGLTCLLNASIVLVLISWLVVGVRQFRDRSGQFIRFSAIVTLLILATLAPWATRNYLVFGRWIWTRSNLGLELGLSNSDYATASVDTINPEWRVNHPFSSEIERAKLQRLGEIKYNEERRVEALQWIRSHPSRFAWLTIERVFLFWFPVMLRRWQTALEVVLTILAMAGLISLAKRRQACAWPVVLVLVAFPLVYYIVEAAPRYRYPVEPFLLLLGGYFLWPRTARLLGWLRSKCSQGLERVSAFLGHATSLANLR